ncbi:MAG: DNA primase small subunit PriS [Thermoplasmata archaeon]|nr:DNA primase small subunit PriS [Thermoplasmata archaeon]
MAKTVALDAPTIAWARGVFARYYQAADVAPPLRLARREFAAFPFLVETSMRRHETLPTPDEFHAFLRREVPRHVYYSAAYYRRPAELSMAAKEWLGADLLFDLDADHLRGADTLGYAGQLGRVKERLVDLVDDFLVRDFGISPSEMSLVFSGGRGYHVHVRDERFLPLSSPERRELVDYVQGTGFDARRTIAESHLNVRADPELERRGGASGVLRVQELSPPESPGWKGRTTRAVLALLARWQSAGRDRAVQDLVGYGLPLRRARQMAKILLDEGGADRIRNSLTLEVFPSALASEFLEAVVPAAAVAVQGETDAPVTTDIHRLIRLPSSLHGGTGLRVVPLSREALERFDPFRDAAAPAPADERVPVVFRETVSHPWGDGRIEGSPGSTAELPTGAALFLTLRGEAGLRA